MPSSLEIAQEAELRPIAQIADALGLSEDEYDPYGRFKAAPIVGTTLAEQIATKQTPS